MHRALYIALITCGFGGALLIYAYMYSIQPEESLHNSHASNLEHLELNTSEQITVLYKYHERNATLAELDTLEKVKRLTGCLDRPMVSKIEQRGAYWVLYNYVMAETKFRCHESITYTTQADYSFVDNLLPVVERWRGPISLALYAPGSDFDYTLESIAYLRDCTGDLVKKYVTFHIYFNEAEHLPKGEIRRYDQVFATPYDCSLPAPYLHISPEQMYRSQNELMYPINVGRNIAREAAQTYYIFPCDIELYPSPNVIPQFLEMIANNSEPLRSNNSRVFPLVPFEVREDQEIPDNKTKLQEMLAKKTAIAFHLKVCAECHRVPKGKEWRKANETNELRVFHVGKNNGSFSYWEPFYIGTHAEPLYDERLTWEGQRNKIVQSYPLCVLDYDFLILNNAFLVHRPGIKVPKRDPRREKFKGRTINLIKKSILPEMRVLFGVKEGCNFRY